MSKFLVMRKEGLFHGRGTPSLHSSNFPVLVDYYAPSYVHDLTSKQYEEIVQAAFKQRGWEGYSGIGKSYLVFAVTGEPVQVSFKRRQDYDVVVEAFEK